MLFAGIDVGSSSAQAVLFDGEKIVAYASMLAKPVPDQSARAVIEATLAEAGAVKQDIVCCIGTGYGREKIDFALENVSEISCLAKGAFWLNPKIRTIIDIGAQDSKLISVMEDGRLKDFVMNDKCAAGSGRFLEKIAKTFGLPITEFGPLALSTDQPAPIQNNCPIYVNSDALSRMTEGWSKAGIALSAANILARRLINGSGRIKMVEQLCLTGGVAKNLAVVRSLAALLDIPIQQLPIDQQVVGALGAAVFAHDRYFSVIEERQEHIYGM